MTARVAAVAMQKGGVGKTTSTLNLARAAAVCHQARVLVVDLDPQGNTSSTLAADDVAPDQVTVADAVVPDSDVALRDVVVPTIWELVDLAPATDTLAAAEARIAAASTGREHRLRKALAPVLGDYDLVLIDNAPALGLLLVNALTASDVAVLVAEPDQWSADGLSLLHRTLTGVIEYSNPHLTVAGVLLNRVRPTATSAELADEIATGVRNHFGQVPVWLDRKVPLWQGIPDHLAAGLGLDQGPAKLRALAEDTYRPIVADLLAAAEVSA
ncbi:ATPase involved in chromosome partitioning [Saccharomonospora piscinae]|uniref:ATPase involved in chromosome partitioning n=1 Tax=Saccharomonospora piscinae TaxID=687388 RepID=A0A1V8ZW13_SACPI|nr:ParA family protein [Saccharomonospora piscinae]OQO88983.1 ATPase involved in chromosome partitioning [Saccharomonospora piscinae]